MPLAPPRICGTCGQTGCTDHQRPAWAHRTVVPRIRGRKLQRLRDQLFDKHPLCVECESQGRTTIATIRDHVQNLADRGRDDERNVQPLCAACHDAKTHAESVRGQQTGGWGVGKCL